ncbi:hypothetical protein GGR54DRAFT_255090 [Hypoxylon sp. NC1633]|nr:hypothetical protein GGR54DRAFT_255090 [Hypoxylon sp. NC1633]
MASHDYDQLAGLQDSAESEYSSDPSTPQKESRTRHHPTMTIDWRGVLCRFLDRPSGVTDEEILDELDAASSNLREIKRVKAKDFAQSDEPRFQVINRIRCRTSNESGMYMDSPWVVESGPYLAHLRGSNAIRNLELYLEQNKETSFIVYREFECCAKPHNIPDTRDTGLQPSVDPGDLLVGEYVTIISDELRSAFVELSRSALKGIIHPDFDDVESISRIHRPYLWWFHRRAQINSARAQLGPAFQRHISTFEEFLDTSLGDEWAGVDSLLSEGRMNALYLNYLFVPHEICISKAKNSDTALLEAFESSDWLGSTTGTRDYSHAFIEGISWKFNGNFQRDASQFSISKLPSRTRDFSISDLTVYPARFASKYIVNAIRMRGRMFWKCRHRNYVCYKGTVQDGPHSMADSRFMIDTATYKQMHGSPNSTGPPAQTHSDLGPEIMSQDNPDLGDEFYMCLPTTLNGFNMQKKEWVSLQVGLIEDVTWNEEAFRLLVIDEGTKELVKAVVTNQLHEEDQADMIRGKGNGLFILLHGGPGTGKTLTAESVAEIAKKPLYKVTCGDIGTKAEEVEKYLEVVLLLGKTWGCVVLLDEADVFLEQRSLHNLERNALVSVFLRVLEYYDGILILTSNRVGTFDEAFKSRIQLTLRYKNLGQDQRYQIWSNFIKRLEILERTRKPNPTSATSSAVQSRPGIGIDVDGIREHLSELAACNLNRREIRNAISTARQLALYKRQPLMYEHLDRVINEANKFEDYIKELNRGFSADEIQKDKGER